MELEKLSSKELADLERQIAEKRKREARERQDKKQQLKDLCDDFVGGYFHQLEGLQETMKDLKNSIFEDAKAVIDLKKEALNIDEKALELQQSHSISNLDFSKTIIVGHNTVDGWDEVLASSGVSKVREWLASKINDQNKELISLIKSLLKPNKDGVLKANRVMELASQAQQIGDPALINAVNELQEAYQPKKTTTFVKAKMRTSTGQDVWLSLSMSNV